MPYSNMQNINFIYFSNYFIQDCSLFLMFLYLIKLYYILYNWNEKYVLLIIKFKKNSVF